MRLGKFIARPTRIDAVKWDGSPDGAAEVKDLLKSAGYVMDSFRVSHFGDGRVDMEGSVIVYFRGKDGDETPGRGSSAYREYKMSHGWLVLDGTDLKTVNSNVFNSKYLDLDALETDSITSLLR